MDPIYVTMSYSKDTPGTNVYVEYEDNTAIRQLYVKKGHLPKPLPQTLVITIEDGDDHD